MTTLPPLCLECRHLDPDAPASTPRCKAFPQGIPPLIWLGEVEHTTPIPGDNGIQFERASE
jgi:hypothetical protein